MPFSQLGDLIQGEMTSTFDEILGEVKEKIIIPKAKIETHRKFKSEMDALGEKVPKKINSRISELEANLEKEQENLKKDFEKMLDTEDPEEVIKLVKKTKFATRKNLSGSTFLLSGSREVQNRINEETAEELVKMSPLRVLDIVKDDKHPQVERFTNMYGERNIEEDIEQWIDNNIKNEMYNLRCKEHYEEMKEFIYTDDMVKNIVIRWIDMMNDGIVSEGNRKEVESKSKELFGLFEKNLTII